MRYLLIVLFAFIAYPAGAERYEGDLYPLDPSALYGIYVTIVEPDDAGFIGRIVHHNRETLPAPNQGYRETFLEFETERGCSSCDCVSRPTTHAQVPTGTAAPIH
jgi:hypothetical protein